jgi:hypothetical protein
VTGLSWKPAISNVIGAESLSAGIVMEIKLTASFVLSDEHSKSRLKMPVLANLRTNEAYNPSELVEPYPSWGKMQAREVVRRMIDGKAFNDQEKYFIERFVGKSFQ